jgi:hypothetical protein
MPIRRQVSFYVIDLRRKKESGICVKQNKTAQNTSMDIQIDYLSAELIEKLLLKQWVYMHDTYIDEDIFHHIGLREYGESPKEACNAWKALKEVPYRNG